MLNQQNKQLDMTIAGVPIRLCIPQDMEIPWDMKPFLTTEIDPLVHYQVELIDTPLTVTAPQTKSKTQMRIYPHPEGWLRVYPHTKAPNGCEAAVLLRNNRHHTLYLPFQELERYKVPGVLSPLLGLEHVLMQEGGFILHSSVVVHDGQAVLFCGPSGMGKSTQAALWQEHIGAKIINGDRCAVMCRDNGVFGCGSPFSGSSEIYLPDEAPIKAIVFLQQGEENTLSPVSPRVAFTQLYAQSAVNPWNAEYMQQLCQRIEDVISTVPLYNFSCLPDQSAVTYLRDALYLP